ncbi:MAG: putative amidohydrolase, partial [Planctomycetota bacterium]
MSLPKRSLGMLLMALVTTAAGQASSLCAPLSEVTEAVLPTSAARPSAPNQRKRTVTRDRRIVSERIAVVGAKVITVDADNTVHTPGMVITEDGIIEYVGPPKELDSRTRKIDVGESWIIPGLVDLHTHIHGNGYNDMVQAVNPELRASPDFGQHNWYIKRGCAAGVTTLFGIPGSGTNMGG